MQLTSPAFEANQPIPSKYTCDGDNINPPLTIAGIPEKTQSLGLIMDDPDAPRGDWVHWLLWNIDPTTTEIEENSVPAKTTQGVTDFGKMQYGGPCPHQGTHHYHFKLYALDTMLNLQSAVAKPELLTVIDGHILDQTELIGTYARN